MPNSSTAEAERCERCGELPLCDGLGVLSHDVPYDHPDFGKLFRCPHLGAASDEERQARLRRLSNLEAFADKRFDNFEVPRAQISAGENKSLKFARDSARNFAEEPTGWLILTGTFGSGKTHLAAAVGNERLAQGDVVLFITAPDLLDHLRSTYGPTSEVGYDEQFERIRSAQLLILDDLGAENPSPWAGEKLYQLLNHRHSRRLPTVITTNVDLDSIEGRIRSRMLDEELFRHASISAPDYRTETGLRQQQLTNPSHYRDMSLDNFDVSAGASTDERKNLENVLRAAREYAENPDGWLALLGNYGSGKTHLAAAIANHRIDRGFKVVFSTVPDMMDWLRVSFGSGSTLSFQQRFQMLRDAPLLVLDDLPASQGTPWVREKLFQLIEYRYTGQLPTVFTSANEIEQLDERIATRLYDRRRCRPLAITARAYALRNKDSRPRR